MEGRTVGIANAEPSGGVGISHRSCQQKTLQHRSVQGLPERFELAQLRTEASHFTFKPASRASLIKSSTQSIPKAAWPDSRASHSWAGKWVCSQKTPCTLEGFNCARPWSRRVATRSKIIAEAGSITPQSAEPDCPSCYGLKSCPSAYSRLRGI